MGIVKDVKITITGQIPDDCMDNDYKVVLAKLQVVCAEHNLDLETN